jgi:myosin heavy subunit
MSESPARMAAKASFRRRKGSPTLSTKLSFRARASRHGIKNLPKTPRLLGNLHGLHASDETNVFRPDAEDLFWIRVPATEEEGGGYKFVPASIDGEGSSSKKDCFRFVQKAIHGHEGPEVGTTFTVNKMDIGPPVDTSGLDADLPNMVDITHVHDSTILENLRKRYARDEFMTAVGPILVVVNPFKFHANKYGHDIIQQYHQDSSLSIEKPHVYDVAERAFTSLCSERNVQAILISGESGAGKTETTKTCLRYLSEVAGADSESVGGDIDGRILSANPVLEAFGNAKTLRNDNSSRFGKWLEIHFSHDRLTICGCTTVSYLLEKTRVIGCGPGERSYHIFYQLLASSDDHLKKNILKIPLDTWNAYATLTPSGGPTSGEIDRTAIDAREFDVTTDAMQHLGFGNKAQQAIFKVLAGILSIGNIHFSKDASQGFAYIDNSVANRTVLDHASFCFGVDAESLEKALCVQTLIVAGEATDRKLNPDQANENRNSLSKALYGSIFDHLIERFNASMTPSSTAKTLVVGILDIFGFEIFEQNSFEQLCINFANEKLQQHFNRAIFKEEIRACEEEGIVGVQLNFSDNQDVLDLIEARGKRAKFGPNSNKTIPPMGLLPMLDEEGRIVGGSDAGFLNKIRRTHEKNKRLQFKGSRRGQKTAKTEFWIHHYADHVKYDVTNFVDKNRDILQPDLENIMTNSKNVFISSTLFAKKEEDESSGETKKSSRKAKGTRTQKTQGGLFYSQLKSLMTILSHSKPHYIRCIKPNNLKKPRIFSAGMCNRQLACSGVYEAVRIRKQGYPHRFYHHDFIRRYWTAAPNAVYGYKPDSSNKAVARKYAQDIVTDLERRFPDFVAIQSDEREHGSPGCLVGNTRVLMPETHFTWLESYRLIIQERAVYDLQRVGRGFIARTFCRSLTKSRKLLRAAIKAGDVSSAQEILQRVKRRTGKRVGFLLEQQQVQRLVEQHRQRQKLKEVIEAAKSMRNKKSSQPTASVIWESREQLTAAHDYLTHEETGLGSISTELTDNDKELLQSAKRSLEIVNDMTNTRNNIMKAIESPTVAGLSRSIAQAKNMQQLHGTFCSDLLHTAEILLTSTASSQIGSKEPPHRAPPMPAKMKITREQQAIEIGVDPAIYQAQMEGM